jgi:primosomal protein N' (replication factor Y)
LLLGQRNNIKTQYNGIRLAFQAILFENISTMTYYYSILVATTQYHGQTGLTYSSDYRLPVGAVVNVPMRNRMVLGIVEKKVDKPGFVTKNITEIYPIPVLPAEILTTIYWLNEYYPAPLGTIVQLFLPKTLHLKDVTEIPDYHPEKINSAKFKLPPLNKEQKIVIRALRQGSYILHGETGSGKTRIYQELSRNCIQAGKSVIILTPEISLTSQLSKNFINTFKSQVILVHSRLTPKAKRDSWLRTLTSLNPLIIIGARSAIFYPVKNIGAIIIDEAHEPAYKQEQSPAYQTVRVASKLAQLHNAILLLGSATPSIVDYFIAQQKKSQILRMQQSAVGTRQINISVIDLKDPSEFTRSSFISDKLLTVMNDALAKQEQILLFLNRRGTARSIICQNCGWQALCPNCDVALVYHGDSHSFRCHSCSYKMSSISSCPICKKTDIIFKSIGTKAIVSEVERLFPKARVQRFDNDNLKADRFEQQYIKVFRGGVDIIVGTQTLAKGLDLPKLAVVGVIIADTSLYTPDYTSQERLYQLISQVIGRIGRGYRRGQAVIQTYLPTNPVLKAAINNQWDDFYKTELAERQRFTFPPYCYLLKLACKRHSRQSAQTAATNLAKQLKEQALKIQINGPAPAFHEKTAKLYEWQLIIKAKQRSELIKVIKLLPNGWTYDIDPINLL